jgi:hypothetical protein
LARYSEDFSNAVWVTDGTTTVTSNATNDPNGNLTADRLQMSNSQRRYIYQNISVTSSTLTYSIYLRASSNQSVRIGTDQTCGFYRGALICNVTTEWQRFTLTVSGVTSGTLAIVIDNITSNITQCTGTAVGVDIFAWGAQVVEGSSAQTYFPTTDRLNVPRLSYMYGSCPALLLEPQRTNLFFNSGWTGGGSIPTNWTAFITGSTTAVTSIKNNSVSAYRFSGTSQRAFFIYVLPVTSGVTYAISVYVESVTTTGDVGFMLSFVNIAGSVTYFRNGVAITGSTTVEAGYTYTMLFVPSATASADIRIGMGAQGSATANYVLSMPQMEVGAYSTTFILSPTGASATRVADSFSRNNIYTNGLITSSGGTWFVELRGNISLIADNAAIGLWLGTASGTPVSNGTIYFRQGGGSQRVNVWKYESGTGTQLYTTTTDTTKIAIKWNGSTADIFANGTKVVSATSFTTTIMENLNCTAGRPFFVQSMALYPTPLSDTDCTTLTTL